MALAILAFVGIAASLQSLSWQVLTRLRYTRGTCRVVAADIVQVGDLHELRVAHQVEIDGQAFGRTENTEQFTPSYSDRKDAEESLLNYAVGTVHPCWYSPNDPAHNSVLVRRDMDTGTQSAVLAISLLIGAVGTKLIVGRSRVSQATQA